MKLARLLAAFLCIVPATTFAVTVAPPFSGTYFLVSLGGVTGLPTAAWLQAAWLGAS